MIRRKNSSCLPFLLTRCSILRIRRLNLSIRLTLKSYLSKSRRTSFHSTNGMLGLIPSSRWWKLPLSRSRKVSTMTQWRILMVWLIPTSNNKQKVVIAQRIPLFQPRATMSAHLELLTRSEISFRDRHLTRRNKKSAKKRRDSKELTCSEEKVAPWSKASNIRLREDLRTLASSRSLCFPQNQRRSSRWASLSVWRETSSWVTRAVATQTGQFWVLAQTQWPPSGISLTHERLVLHEQLNLKNNLGIDQHIEKNHRVGRAGVREGTFITLSTEIYILWN